MSLSSSTREPPPPLHTHADLANDQYAYFAHHHHLPPDQIPPNTPAYSALRPVHERSVRPRRRRRRPSSAAALRPAFPPAQQFRTPVSQFARNQPTSLAPHHHEPPPSTPPPQPPASAAPSSVDDAIAQMTPQQIRDAQREIAAVLPPDTLAFLKTRSRAPTPADPQPPPSSHSKPPLPPEQPTDPDVEHHKRLWMTDASVPLDTQAAASLDSLLEDALSHLGPLSSRRFDLHGQTLTAHQIAQLPTHLGLHHHGGEPANAGYTLADLLLLTRSTVLGQRVLSLRILTALLHTHASLVSAPLVDSGGLALVFAPFPANLNFEAALTNRIAFVEAVEALVTPHASLPPDRLVPGFYLASRFYSPNVHVRPPRILTVLAESNCIPVLVNIARVDASNAETHEIALRALAMVRVIVTFSPKASRATLENDDILQTIQHLCVGQDPLNPITTLLACDTLAQALVNAAWGNSELVKSLDNSCFSDTFLRRVTTPLTWFIRHDRQRSTYHHFQAAKGAIRLLRAALAFERALLPFTSCAQAICSLTHERDDLSVESYLALEAYAHTLYTTVSAEERTGKENQEEDRSNRTAPARGEASTPKPEEQLQFAKDQLSGLVPVALEASRVFVSPARSESSARKAAAGHFVSTILAIAAIPLDQTVLRRLLNQSSLASERIHPSSAFKSHDALTEVQAEASLSHAAARTLARVQVEPDFVQRDLNRLMTGANLEFQYLAKRQEELVFPWRPISNACAEWIGLLAKVAPGVRTVKLALQIIPWINDEQVILDVLARCILRASCMTAMSPAIGIEQARKCAQELLPIAQTELGSLFEVTDSSTQVPHFSTRGDTESKLLINAEDLGSFWVKHEELRDSFFPVVMAWSDNKILPPDTLFRILLKSPSAWYENAPQLFPLLRFTASEAVDQGTSMFRSRNDTVLSSLSTAPDSVITTSVLALADHMVSRGPFSSEDQIAEDHLATVVLSIMCAPDVDDSLRGALWKKTVQECAGAVLYENARYLGDENTVLCEDGEICADALIFRYCDAMRRGLLKGNRRSPVLTTIILRTLAIEIEKSNLNDLRTLPSLMHALRSVARIQILDALQEMVQLSTGNDHHANVVSNWLAVHTITE